MSDESRNFGEIPAAACTLVAGAFELKDNGENTKTAPIEMVARSGQPIEHWYWGRVVHDLAGMHMHKSRLPIDYVHDAKEVIGYLNHFDHESGDLIASGALVPFKDNDRATEIVHKSKLGVPYEASINFGGEGIKVQELADGEVADVNGYQLEGPAVIVREWPLRGVAVCPYGADMNTESAMAFSNSKQVFSASVISEPEAKTEEGSNMSESVEVVAQVETPEVELSEQEDVKTVDAEVVEESVEAEEVEADAVETEEEVEVLTEQADEDAPAELSREEFTRIADEFGSEIAVQTVRDGGDYNSALAAYAKGQKDENEKLTAQIAEMNENKSGTPAKVSGESKPAVSVFKTGK